MSRSCVGCRHWQPIGPPDNPHQFGECRAGLPVFVLAGGVWPQTTPGDWCAHHDPLGPSTASGDTRAGAATVVIEDNGLVRVTHFSGETLELSALDGLTDDDKRVLERLAWPG